ncbi:L-rhamnose-proton symporter [Escherichia coli DEC3F]|nr:L-rhamnose-proton symporter [Escherichia coli DEC3A]EHU66104.1 L-rhamnose-proton symporter [Escherichia coli DEC3C]EHU69624.1 L-rhamnose-proton symporter [Escherichia coli DEC3D]EHU80958.1 L-rhamnose-proton symporter [Escherichia coli DEC3F]EHU86846.1 L-rhamnose-proton symporter [Escherichia coli DEC4A]EHV00946.1 L-rhamnose-proton symporter [Escherichia coli DEC4D]EHV32531.1 L-rhamnose-proton symporter [Escherichia coli DEC5C]
MAFDRRGQCSLFLRSVQKSKKWSWETMWSVGGIVSWIILP